MSATSSAWGRRSSSATRKSNRWSARCRRASTRYCDDDKDRLAAAKRGARIRSERIVLVEPAAATQRPTPPSIATSRLRAHALLAFVVFLGAWVAWEELLEPRLLSKRF